MRRVDTDVVMVPFAFQMRYFVSDVEHVSRRQPAALHRKAMQWQQHQQENAQAAAHGIPVQKFGQGL